MSISSQGSLPRLSIKTYVIDIDDTIIFTEETYCKKCGNATDQMIMKDPHEIKLINQAYKKGHIIIMFTGRDWSKYKATEKQLKDCGVKYHKLICGKPVGIYVDKDAIKTLKGVKL